MAELPCLSVLDVSNNYLSSISPAVAHMKALEDLNLGNNKLGDLPDGECFPCPEVSHLFLVAYIAIWRIPRLRSLNAQSNQIKAISSTIIHCQSLYKLILDCNDISYLPMQITKLSSLKYLSLAGNQLKALPQGN